MIRRSRPQQQPDVEPAAVPGQDMHSGAAPRWVDVLFVVQLIYVAAVAMWMLIGFGGPTITHYVALVSDEPAALIAVIIAAATARRISTLSNGAIRVFIASPQTMLSACGTPRGFQRGSAWKRIASA